MKVYIYAIAKNEEKLAKRFCAACRDADGVYVLDTGSTDETVSILTRHGCHVEQKVISPWRFDTARNESLALVPADADICLCVDIDEVPAPGWRKIIEKSWENGVNRARYTYVWNHKPDGTDGVMFYADKAHTRNGFRWAGPVHEYLCCDVHEVSVTLPDMRIDHWADDTKPRSQYLPLLELAVQEQPENDRYAHYLGREYYFHGEYDKAIAELQRHLSLKTAKWNAERASSMMYIAKCYQAMQDDAYGNNLHEAEYWYLKACHEDPGSREPWYALGLLFFSTGDYYSAIYAMNRCVNIHNRKMTYLSTAEAWGKEPWRILGACWKNLGMEEYAKNCLSAGGMQIAE